MLRKRCTAWLMAAMIFASSVTMPDMAYAAETVTAETTQGEAVLPEETEQAAGDTELREGKVDSPAFLAGNSTLNYIKSVVYKGVTYGYWTVDGEPAFCIEYAKEGPGTGMTFHDEIYENADIIRVLHYGWTGPEQWSGFGADESKGIVLTSLALSHYYSSNPADVSQPAYVDMGLKEFIDYIEARSVPQKDISFSPASVKAYADGDTQRTEEITFKGDPSNTVTFTLGKDITLVDSGNAEHTGMVTLHGGDKFYLKAPYAVGKTWSTGTLSGSIKQYNSVIAKTIPSYQNLVRYKQASDPVGTAQLDVEWTDQGKLLLYKSDGYGKQVGGAKIKIESATTGLTYSKEFTIPVKGLEVMLSPGKYVVVETAAPKSIDSNHGYLWSSTKKYTVTIKSGDMETLQIVNKEPKGKLTLTKTDRETGSKAQGYGTLTGAGYQLYANENIKSAAGDIIYPKDYPVDSIKRTDENRKIVWVDLPLGKYYVKEIEPSEGYLLDATKYPVELTYKDSSTKVITKSLSVKETVKKGKIRIYKYDEESKELVTRNDTTFGIYAIGDVNIGGTDYANGQLIQTVTTVNGVAESMLLPAGAYKVRETAAPNLYSDKGITEETVEIKDNEQVVEFRAYNPPVTGTIHLKKADSETGAAQGKATLAGAEYTLYAAEDIKNPANGSVIYANGEKVTKKIIGERKWGEEGTKETRSDGSLSWENLPMGKYNVKETRASQGYTLNPKVDTVTLDYVNSQTREIVRTLDVKEDIIRGDIELAKFGKNSINGEATTMQPLANVIFSITSNTTGNTWYIRTNENGYADSISGIVYSRITSNAAGEISVDPSSIVPRNSRGFFIYDTYTIQELNPPEGYERIHNIVFNLEKQSYKYQWILEDKDIISAIRIEKVDEESGQTIALAGTKFRIYDKDRKQISMVVSRYPKVQTIDEFVTDETGSFVLPEKLKVGTYYLEEVEAPNGYLKGAIMQFKIEEGKDWSDPLTIIYKDTSVKGKIKIVKTDSLSAKRVAGAVYEIKAAKDIVTNDGTIHAYAGEVVDTLTLDENGSAESKELYLGTYKVKEIQSPAGYKLDQEEHEAEIVYKDDTTPVVVTTLNVKDEPNVIYIKKIAAHTEKELPGAELQLLDQDGNVIEEWTTDGKLHEIKYLAEGTYTLHEKKAPAGYLPAEDILVECSGGIIQSPFVMIDKPTDTTFEKIAEDTGTYLAGAELQLLDQDGNVIEEWTSTDEAHVIKGLPAGTYTLHEKKAPAGYVTAEDITVEIKETAEIQKFQMIDKIITVTISKIAEDTGKELPGAELQLLDQDGNVIEEWTSTDEAHVIKGLPAGTYTLHEKKAPAGYVTAKDMTLNVTEAEMQGFRMLDAAIQVTISKTAEDTGEELPGAELQLLDADGKVVREWITTDEPYEIKDLPAGTYTLHEKKAPAGYVRAEDMTVEIKETAKLQQIEMIDRIIRLDIHKQDADTGKELPGARLQLLDSKKNVIEEWESGEKAKRFEKLPAGTYTLHEVAAPDGYAVAGDMDFVVRETAGVQGVVFINMRIGSIYTSMHIEPSGSDDRVAIGFPPKLKFPKTGDGNNIMLYVWLMVASGLALLALAIRKKRKKAVCKVKKKIIFFLLLTLMCSKYGQYTPFAASKPAQTDVIEYESDDPEKQKEFPESIQKDGKKYLLDGVEYETVKKTPVKEKKEVTKVIESEYLPADQEFKPQEEITDDGIKYKITDCSVLDGSAYTKDYTENVNYLQTDTTIPDKREIGVTDDAGNKLKVAAELVATEPIAEGEWLDADIDITFDHYDTGVFEWQGRMIDNNSQHPLAGYEELLLQSVGADTETYRVVTTDWKGEPYQVDGVTYRDAQAKIQYFVNYLQATYQGTQEFVKYQSTYTGKAEFDSTTDFKYTIRATASYIRDNSLSMKQILMLASIGVLLLVLLAVLILFVVAKRKKQEKDSGTDIPEKEDTKHEKFHQWSL